VTLTPPSLRDWHELPVEALVDAPAGRAQDMLALFHPDPRGLWDQLLYVPNAMDPIWATMDSARLFRFDRPTYAWMTVDVVGDRCVEVVRVAVITATRMPARPKRSSEAVFPDLLPVGSQRTVIAEHRTIRTALGETWRWSAFTATPHLLPGISQTLSSVCAYWLSHVGSTPEAGSGN
jgi:hypothetical protein